MLGTVRFRQPVIVVIVIAYHHVIEATVAAADFGQQPVFAVQQYQFRAVAVGDPVWPVLFVVVKID
ncbi:hypothetical protein, partial [Xenorhabdus doucetiae]|uniref:hypothetical protein n=1 Tax=Xenorhabdus doucetiae TaxID=351671 RepID=UPI002B40BE23